MAGRVELCLSQAIATEYAEVLDRFTETKEGTRRLLAALGERYNALFVAPSERVFEVLRDPSDNMFLECALAAQAQGIISGDAHLLSLGCFRGIPILSPAQFLARFEDMQGVTAWSAPS